MFLKTTIIATKISNMKKIIFPVLALLLISYSCQNVEHKNSKKAKYVFLFIGDGMGIQVINTTQVYIDSVLKSDKSLSFINFPVQTFATTYAANQYITCSAAAGTALSTGSKTSIGTLGLNFNHTDTLFSIAKKFKDTGYKVGLLTSVSIDHATPAAFFAHQGSRGSSYEIAVDMLKSGYDFYASGGFVDPYGKKLKEPVESIYSLGKKYSFAFTSNLDSVDILKSNFKSIVYSTPDPASESTLKNYIDADSADVTLAELTKKAIQTLDNPKGFFMMVEGGKIDWACHSNDGATAIKEVIAFSDAIIPALEFYKAHPDETLIIVTADHETGGFSLGNKENKYGNKLSILSNQKVSKENLKDLVINELRRKPRPTFAQMLEFAKAKTGLGDEKLNLALKDEEQKKLLEAYNKTIRELEKSSSKTDYLSESKEQFSSLCIDFINKKAAIGWTSTAHTGSPVPVYVIGNGSELFFGRIDNTDIPKIIVKSAL
ncbi:MAG TPA: alkaline phosphatase [Bacteroidales bacterium]|nr:alkaline phosphatase [Bacteroidales bacterium]